MQQQPALPSQRRREPETTRQRKRLAKFISTERWKGFELLEMTMIGMLAIPQPLLLGGHLTSEVI